MVTIKKEKKKQEKSAKAQGKEHEIASDEE
jgi:hypothetical protein